MIVAWLSRSLGILFLMACFGALMNPPPYILIAAIFFLMGLVLLPSTNKITKKRLNWEIKGGTKATAIIFGLMIVCLIVPQVHLEISPFSTNYSEQEVNRDRSKQI